MTKVVCRATVLALMATAFAQDDPRQTGPTTLVVMYRCAPADRVKLRQLIASSGIRRFQHWKEEGILADYHLLFSRYVDTEGWDLMALINFSSYSAVAQWKKIEQSSPAGLSPEILIIATQVSSYPADRMRWNAAGESQPEPVYLVLPYSYSVSMPEYLTYVDDYVKPQLEGWLEEGVLSSYDFLFQRYSGGRPWNSLLVLKYKDDASFGDREKVMARVRARLQSNPAWQARAEGRQNFRKEGAPVIADELPPPR